jgi:hypothetical protein
MQVYTGLVISSTGLGRTCEGMEKSVGCTERMVCVPVLLGGSPASEALQGLLASTMLCLAVMHCLRSRDGCLVSWQWWECCQ